MIQTKSYELKPQKKLNALDCGQRKGALLRITFKDSLIGYADLFPWEELGDLPLETQLQMKNTPQFLKSIHYARLDAIARAQGKSLFDQLTIPKSHSDTQGLVKKKMGLDLEKEIAYIKAHPENKWRLDFNESLKPKQFEEVVDALRGVDVDFFEDPFPFDPTAWGRFIRQGIPLGCDRHVTQALQLDLVLIVKPALYSVTPFLNKGKRVVITSYMDHPVGQLFAAYEAAKHHHEIDVPGLLTHTLYEENSFSKQLKVIDDTLIPPSGTGIGFDTLLEEFEWS